nr:MAG TPA: hypothetical protein [Caudoviricetes sp.]
MYILECTARDLSLVFISISMYLSILRPAVYCYISIVVHL